MKKGLYAVLFLWVAVTGIYVSDREMRREASISTVFEDSAAGREWSGLDTCIEGYGKFGVCYLTAEEKEKLVRNIAAALGITSPCTISTEYSGRGMRDGEAGDKAVDIRSTVLTKESINGEVLVKSITEEKFNEGGSCTATQYVYVRLSIYGNIDCANSYRELVEGVFDAMGIEGKVNMNLVGSLAGALNSDEKNRLADSLLEKLDARVVAESRESDMFTIYAYSEGIGSHITIGGSKINVNIAIGYDEEKNMTNVYLASPVNSLDY